MSDSPVERDAQGHVLPGSGSAFGANSTRRLGTGQLAKLRALVEPERDAIVANLIALAKGTGKDAVRAAEVLLDRLAARPKQQSEIVQVSGLKEAATLQGKMDAVVAAVANGEVSADAGRAVLQMLDAYARAKRTDELEARIRALEEGRGRTIDPAGGLV
jgi:hypothetical protein